MRFKFPTLLPLLLAAPLCAQNVDPAADLRKHLDGFKAETMKTPLKGEDHAADIQTADSLPKVWGRQLALLRVRKWALQDKRRTASAEEAAQLDVEIKELNADIARIEGKLSSLPGQPDAGSGVQEQIAQLEAQKTALIPSMETAHRDCDAAQALVAEKQRIFDSWIAAMRAYYYSDSMIDRTFGYARAESAAGQAKYLLVQAQTAAAPPCAQYDRLRASVDDLQSRIDKLKPQPPANP